MQKKPNYLIPRIQNHTVINLDVDSASDHSDISEEEPNQAIPELNRSEKINSFRLIQPVHRARQISEPYTITKRQMPIEIDESEESVSEQNALQLISEQRSIKNDYRPLKRRLIKAANKCKIQRRQFSSTECSICLTNIQNKPNTQIGKLPCHHAFCFDCIYQSSKFANKCPYCRSSYRQIQRGNEFIPIEQKSLEDMQIQDQPCYICGRNDDFDHLLECQYCQSAFCHTYCDNRLSSDIPPEESWYCLSCSEIIANEIEEIQ